jgi:thioredoxin reductase (NADPH)
MTTMSNTRRGLPLTSSRIEKIFPKLTPAQINRIAGHGHVRSVQSGEVLIEQGDTSVPFFVVTTGEVEIVRPLGAHETILLSMVLVNSQERLTCSLVVGL